MKKVQLISMFVIICLLTSVNTKKIKNIKFSEQFNIEDTITLTRINNNGFFGRYVGVEFNQNGDVAHQFSNKITRIIGRYLKQSYINGQYLKIDFNRTKITTLGLDKKGYVEFMVNMPFIKVKKKDSFTGIIHCGTWVNQSDIILLERITIQLIKLKKISVGKPNHGYFTTKEGYKEYWVQFKHKKYQKS